MFALPDMALASSDVKIVVTGSMGAGKSTVVRTISGIPPLTTEVPITDGTERADKVTTTMALDYGTYELPNGRRMLIFGTPGQRRFDFVCRVLARGALGLMILIDDSAEDPLGDLGYYLDVFGSTVESSPVVVGLTHTDMRRGSTVAPYRGMLAARGLSIPVIKLDARNKQSILMAMMALLVSIK